MLPFIFLNFFYQKQCKYAMIIGFAQIRGALLQFLLGKSTLLYLCWLLPLILKITRDSHLAVILLLLTFFLFAVSKTCF